MNPSECRQRLRVPCPPSIRQRLRELREEAAKRAAEMRERAPDVWL